MMVKSKNTSRRSFESNMEDAGRKLSKIFNRLRMMNISLAYGKIISVNENTKTVDAAMDDRHVIKGITLDIVRNGNNGILVFPKVDSTVVVGFIENRPEIPFIVQVTQIDRILITTGATTVNIKDGLIEINGGSNDGLILINELTDKLNALVNTFNSHTHQVSTTGTESAQTGTAAAVTSQAQAFNAEDYENKNITQ